MYITTYRRLGIKDKLEWHITESRSKDLKKMNDYNSTKYVNVWVSVYSFASI